MKRLILAISLLALTGSCISAPQQQVVLVTATTWIVTATLVPTDTPTRTPPPTDTPTRTPPPTATSMATATPEVKRPAEYPVKFTWTSPTNPKDTRPGNWNGWYQQGIKNQGGVFSQVTEGGVTFIRATVTNNSVLDRDGRPTIRIYLEGGADIPKEFANRPLDQGGCRIEVPFRYFDKAIFGVKKATGVISVFSKTTGNVIAEVNLDEKGRPILVTARPNGKGWYDHIADDTSLEPGVFTVLGFQMDDDGIHLLRNGIVRRTLPYPPGNTDRIPSDVHAGAYIIAEDPKNYPQVPNGTIIDNGPISVKCW